MVKTGSRTVKCGVAALVAAALTASLSACGTAEEASRFVVAPGKYDIYTCPQIAEQMEKTQAEVARLDGLMARASQGDGGQFINNIAYGPDYLANRGDLRELRKSAAEKNCANLPAAPQARASDTSIH
jgi:hypothetical protein